MTTIRALLGLLLAVTGLPSPAAALESAPVVTPHAEVRLVADTDAVAPGRPFRLGLHFKLAKGWHVYWVNPGAAGEAPTLDLALPEGATAGGIEWPTPLRLPDGPVMTYGYVDEVLLPLDVDPGGAGGPLPVAAQARWLICEKICIPEEGAFRLELPAGTPAPSASAPLFRAAAARAPRPSPFAASVSPQGMLTVSGAGIAPVAVRDAWFLPAQWGAIDDAAAQPLTVADGALSLALRPGPAFDAKAGLAGTLVLADRTGAETYLAIAATPGEVAAAVEGDLSLAAILGLAFLGGLILNLMPCVFPILAMKAIGLAGLAGRERSAVRAHAGSYVLGVLLGFAVLGGLLIALRAAGMAAGWGFQFQSPVFVAATAWLLLAIGLNLSGVYEVGGRFAGAGGRLAGQGGHAGSLFTGLLVVVVATPCTAPFMGAAVAAAAVSPPATTMAIFAALGLGLAAPYGMLALAPGLARLLPRPGPWMLTLRQALAFPMYAAAVWLAWVVSEQAGSTGVLAVLSGALLVGLAAWLLGLAQRTGGRTRLARAAAVLSLAAAAALLVSPASFAGRADGATAALPADGTEPYSAARLAALRADGRPVFVNMTAAWCVTCIVNERVVLATDTVRAAFAARGVAYLKGDWTSADPAITDYLRARGRDGVPLYVYYPPKGDAVVLPQLLTVDLVLDELDRFGS